MRAVVLNLDLLLWMINMKKLLIILGYLLLLGPVITALLVGLYIIIFPLTGFSLLCTTTSFSMVVGFIILDKLDVF